MTFNTFAASVVFIVACALFVGWMVWRDPPPPDDDDTDNWGV